MEDSRSKIVINKIYTNQEGIELIQVTVHWKDRQIPLNSINIFKYSGYQHSEYFEDDWYSNNHKLLHSLDTPAQQDVYPDHIKFWRFLNGETGKEYYKIKTRILNDLEFHKDVNKLLD